MNSPFPKRKSSQEKFVGVNFKNLLDIDANNEYYSNDYYIGENEINLSPGEIEQQIALLESYSKPKTTEEKLTELRNEMISSAKATQNKIIYEKKKVSDQIISDMSTYYNFQSFDDQKIVINTLANIFKFFPLRSMIALPLVCKTFCESFKIINFKEIYINDNIINDLYTLKKDSKLLVKIRNTVQIIHFKVPFDYVKFELPDPTFLSSPYALDSLEERKWIRERTKEFHNAHNLPNLRNIIIELDHATQIFEIPSFITKFSIIKMCSGKIKCKICDFNLFKDYMRNSSLPTYHNNKRVLY